MALSTNAFRRASLITIGVCVGLIAYWLWPPSTASLLTQAAMAESKGEFPRALEIASRALIRDQNSVEAALFAASMANRMGDPIKELEFCRQIPESACGSRTGNRLKEAGQLALKCGRASDAEFFYRRALVLLPDDLMIHRRLGSLYLGEARRWESTPHLFRLIKGHAFKIEESRFSETPMNCTKPRI